ncbi:MAG: hypothetical protein HFJ24_07365 [Clostridia bacterium]|nr:hypothetical protein [Clostridia bacterium]MCI9275737.1 hypothetical protein [Clostridia bacterium]
MRILKKINKGIVLTCIVLIVLIIYLFNVEIKRNNDKPEIEKVCKDYIELVNKYAVTPESASKVFAPNGLSEEEQKAKKDDLDVAINKSMTTLETSLKDKMIDNELAVRMQKDRIEDFVRNNSNVFSSTLTKFNKEVTKVMKFSFDEDQVIVTLNTKTETETKYLDSLNENKEVSKKNDQISEESITLQKVDGTWKVVYADLELYTNSMDSMGMVTKIY